MATTVAFAALALAGCGSKDDEQGSDGGSSSASGSLDVSVPAVGAEMFDQGELTAKAGSVSVKFDNPSSKPHGVTIEGNGVDAASNVVTGANTTFTVDLEPGRYTYYCPVGDHRARGMEGTLTVS